jgi:flavin-dependent dehydrogenase
MQSFLSMIEEKFKLGKILKCEAHPIPIFSPGDFALGEKRILLVGDAASLVNPFTGEGIFSSLVSGKLASEAIIKDFDEPFQVIKEYEKKMEPLLVTLREEHELFTYYQSLGYKERQNMVKGFFESDAKSGNN